MSKISFRWGITPFLALNGVLLIAVVMAFVTIMDIRLDAGAENARAVAIIVRRLWQSLVLIAAGLVVFFLMAQYFIQPLKSIARAARKIGDGKYDDLDIKHSNGEIGEVSAALMEMAGKLRKQTNESRTQMEGMLKELKTAKERLQAETSRRKHAEKELAEIKETLERERAEYVEELRTASDLINFESSERERIQDELTKSQELESVGRLASTVAHDINNLLTPIVGHAQMAMRKLPEDDRLQSSLREIAKASERLSDLVRQFLSVSNGKGFASNRQASPTPSAEASQNDLRDLPPGTGVVLLVDDEPLVRQTSAMMLREQGYAVIEASNGPEALKLAQAYSGTKIHLLMTDVVMPLMGGKELADRLRSIHPETRVLYTSGYNDESLVNHGALEAGTAFIQKPLTPDTLGVKIQEAFQLSRPGGPADGEESQEPRLRLRAI
jgi:CheY-like chemotaxis protein